MAKLMRKKKATKSVSHGRIYVRSSFNNTLITATDAAGGALAWVSAGSLNFSGARKATPYAAQTAMREVVERVKGFGMSSADIYVSGVGAGREQAIRALGGSGITIGTIRDITPVPHNGPRQRKPRKV